MNMLLRRRLVIVVAGDEHAPPEIWLVESNDCWVVVVLVVIVVDGSEKYWTITCWSIIIVKIRLDLNNCSCASVDCSVFTFSLFLSIDSSSNCLSVSIIELL